VVVQSAFPFPSSTSFLRSPPRPVRCLSFCVHFSPSTFEKLPPNGLPACFSVSISSFFPLSSLHLGPPKTKKNPDARISLFLDFMRPLVVFRCCSHLPPHKNPPKKQHPPPNFSLKRRFLSNFEVTSPASTPFFVPPSLFDPSMRIVIDCGHVLLVQRDPQCAPGSMPQPFFLTPIASFHFPHPAPNTPCEHPITSLLLIPFTPCARGVRPHLGLPCAIFLFSPKASRSPPSTVSSSLLFLLLVSFCSRTQVRHQLPALPPPVRCHSILIL